MENLKQKHSTRKMKKTGVLIADGKHSISVPKTVLLVKNN